MQITLSSTRVILSKKSALGFVLLGGYVTLMNWKASSDPREWGSVPDSKDGAGCHIVNGCIVPYKCEEEDDDRPKENDILQLSEQNTTIINLLQTVLPMYESTNKLCETVAQQSETINKLKRSVTKQVQRSINSRRLSLSLRR